MPRARADSVAEELSCAPYGVCARGFHEAILWVLAGNEPAERFYRARGYRRDGARRHENPWGVDAEVIRYRRSLA